MEPKARSSAFRIPEHRRSGHREDPHSLADQRRSCDTCQSEDIPDRSSRMEPSSRTDDRPVERSCCGSSSTDHATSRELLNQCRSRLSVQTASHPDRHCHRGPCHDLGHHCTDMGCNRSRCTSRLAYRTHRSLRNTCCSLSACSSYRSCSRHRCMDHMTSNTVAGMMVSCSLRRMDTRNRRRSPA